jgi:hypothetical protein
MKAAGPLTVLLPVKAPCMRKYMAQRAQKGRTSQLAVVCSRCKSSAVTNAGEWTKACNVAFK